MPLTIDGYGTFESVPPVVDEIQAGEIDALAQRLVDGWPLNQCIALDEDTKLLPVEIAVLTQNVPAVHWLVAQGAELNVRRHCVFLQAARYSTPDIIRYLAQHGADIHSLNRVGSEAFVQALYGRRFDNLPVIDELGHSVASYGGHALRQAVRHRWYDVIDFFIQRGVDINYHQPDSIYPFAPTPLCVAARYVDLEMCRYLVKHGADVTLTETEGDRPYSIALENKDQAMADYFRGLEPADFHARQNHLMALKAFKLPKKLTALLQSETLTFELPDSPFQSLTLFSLLDTIPFKMGRQSLLRLSQSSDDMTDVVLVWHPKTKSIAVYDQEHEQLTDICGWQAFCQDPVGAIQQMSW